MQTCPRSFLFLCLFFVKSKQGTPLVPSPRRVHRTNVPPPPPPPSPAAAEAALRHARSPPVTDEGLPPYKRQYSGPSPAPTTRSATPGYRGAYTNAPPGTPLPPSPPRRSLYALEEPQASLPVLTRTDYLSLADRVEAMARECLHLTQVVGKLAAHAPPDAIATPPPSPPRATSPPATPRAPSSPATPQTASPLPNRASARSRWASRSRSRSQSPWQRGPTPPPYVPPYFGEYDDGAASIASESADSDVSRVSVDVV